MRCHRICYGFSGVCTPLLNISKKSKLLSGNRIYTGMFAFSWRKRLTGKAPSCVHEAKRIYTCKPHRALVAADHGHEEL